MIPERFVWAAELTDTHPGSHVLEIGCGAGLLAGLLAASIPQGSFTGVDRSPAMTARAAKRNQTYVTRGVARFLQADFMHTRFAPETFDRIVLFNVNFVWQASAPEFRLAKELLKRDGKLVVCYQAPFDITISNADPVIENLAVNGFLISDVAFRVFVPTPAFGVVAVPEQR